MSERAPMLVAAAALLLLAAGAAASLTSKPQLDENTPAAPPIPSPTRKLDEYGNVSWEDEKARLDNFAIELQNDPTATGYLVCYGGRVGRAGEARRRCSRAKGYVSGYRHIPLQQIVTVDGGHREELTVEVWVVPRGVTPPAPAPTVDPREVKFIRAKPLRKPGRRRR